jgi:hypothetical protein
MGTLTLPQSLLDDARRYFEECGSHGHEGTAMIKNGPAGTALVVPAQHPRRSRSGGVSVEVTRQGQMQLATMLGPDDLYVAEAYLVRAVTNACLDIIKATKSIDQLDQDDPRIDRNTETDPTGDLAVPSSSVRTRSTWSVLRVVRWRRSPVSWG